MAPLVCERLHLDDAHRGRSAWGTATSTGESPLAAGARDRRRGSRRRNPDLGGHRRRHRAPRRL